MSDQLVQGSARLPIHQELIESVGNAILPPQSSVSNSARRINIQQVSVGYIVEVGCQTFAIQKKETLIEYLSQYLADPASIEEKHMKGELFK